MDTRSGSFGRRAVVEHPGARRLTSWLRRVLSSPETKGLQLCLLSTGPLLLPLPVAAVRARAHCGWRPIRCPWFPPGLHGRLIPSRTPASDALISRPRGSGTRQPQRAKRRQADVGDRRVAGGYPGGVRGHVRLGVGPPSPGRVVNRPGGSDPSGIWAERAASADSWLLFRYRVTSALPASSGRNAWVRAAG